ncbi:hypothetical protein [Hahella chejuensis]|uniref:hypothetical protein n=1 Tax=Hahella chejuensis TaxID=158327 RepID=UPI0011D08C03|nr:hypothetical protein [Hahella chejuensis]
MKYLATIALALIPALTPAYALPYTVNTPELLTIEASYTAQNAEDTWQYAPPEADIIPRSLIAKGEFSALSRYRQEGDYFSFLSQDALKELYYSASKGKKTIYAANLIVIPEPGIAYLLIISLALLLLRKPS